MDASFYQLAWNHLATACCFLDRIIARCVAMDAVCQDLGRVLWKRSKDPLLDATWNSKFQLTAGYGNLARICNPNRILANLLKTQCEFLAFDLLESSCGKEIEHHISRANDLRFSRARMRQKALCLLPAVFHPVVHQGQESPYPVYLLAFGVTELSKLLQQFGRCGAVFFRLLFDLIEERI